MLLWFCNPTAPPQLIENWWPSFIFAQPAVETFIILSGFAISFLLHSQSQTYWTFIRGRFFRIYPVYLVCLILGICTINLTPIILNHAAWRDTVYFQWVGSLSESERHHTIIHTLTHLTLLNGLVPKKILLNATGTLLPPAWSISLEWQYYLMAPIIAVLVCSSGRLLLLGCVAYLGMRYGEHWRNPNLAFFPAQLPLFLIGIGSYHIYARYALSGRSIKFAIPVAAVIAGAVLLTPYSVSLTIWGLVFGSLFVTGNGLFERIFSLLRRFLLHAWLQRLGKISYPIYLVHCPVIVICLSIILILNPAISAIEAASIMFLCAIPIIVLLATLLHRFIEVPFQRFGKPRKNSPLGPQVAPAQSLGN
jgi:peptidoglycan/LPS O-acetylase OafA/YrhL